MKKKAMQRRATGAQRIAEPVFRELRIEKSSVIDAEERIVRLSFASEYPVERWDFFEPWIEVLGHEESEVDLARLNGGGTLHYNHERTREARLGAVLKAWVEDGKSFADVQFSKNPRVNDVWEDVRDGLLSNVSVGYFILRREPVPSMPEDGETPRFRVTRWQPFEISIVDVPADPTIGVGRSAPGITERGKRYTIIPLKDERNRSMKKRNKRAAGDGEVRGEQLAAFLNDAIDALVTDDMPRESVIQSMADAAGMEADAVTALLEGSEECPTLETLSAFAEALGVETDEVVAAAEADGCEFEDEGDGDEGGAGGEGEEGAAGAGDGDGGGRGANKGNQRGANMTTRNKVVRINAERSGRQQEFARQSGIRELFAPHRERIGANYQADLDKCLNDPHCSIEKARAVVLEAIGKSTTPAGGEGSARGGEDARDKFRTGVAEALQFRAGQYALNADARNKLRGTIGANHFRGMTMVELAREACRLGNVDLVGLTKDQVIQRAFTSSDLPQILADVANKSMLLGYEEAPETWNLWTLEGSLSDFKTAKRVGLSEFDALEKINEKGEYRYGTIGDRGEEITLATYGKIFKITRQTLINDDLGALGEIPNKMGRAAARTVGDIAYAVLTGNPTMSDGVTLFHATHNNLNEGTAGVPSVDRLSAMKAAMALQKDTAEAAHGLNIRPGFILCPVTIGDTMRQIVGSAYDPRSTLNAEIPNPVRNIGDVIDDPRLDAASTTAYYLVGARGFDTVEVAFLDGNSTPFMDQQDEWNIDGSSFKVRIDVAAAAREWRTFQKNDGA